MLGSLGVCWRVVLMYSKIAINLQFNFIALARVQLGLNLGCSNSNWSKLTRIYLDQIGSDLLRIIIKSEPNCMRFFITVWMTFYFKTDLNRTANTLTWVWVVSIYFYQLKKKQKNSDKNSHFTIILSEI